MKTLIATSGNILAGTDGEGGYEPLVEVVLLVSEPKYEADASGFVKRSAVSDIRFGSTPKTLRNVAAELVKLAAEAEKELAAFRGDSTGGEG